LQPNKGGRKFALVTGKFLHQRKPSAIPFRFPPPVSPRHFQKGTNEESPTFET
jgi:hypothetical protein